MIARAERQGFWRLRQLGLAWKEALEEGSGEKWVAANRLEVWQALTKASFSGVPCAMLLVSARDRVDQLIRMHRRRFRRARA